jgi:hypothetical protein
VLPDPYRIVDGWAKLPDGRKIGAVGKVDVAPDGTHIWAIIRCEPLYDQARFGDECRDSKTNSIAIDSRRRVFVGDRGNNRIQIFEQDGTSLAVWTQFGKPSGIFFDSNDQIYVADSESDDVQNPGWEMGIRIGDAKSGWVNAFILYPWGDPRKTAGDGAEFIAVDKDGNIYGGEPNPKRLQKYVRVRP